MRDSESMEFKPALRPGAPILRRDARRLQIGTSPGVVVADRPGLLPFLLSLDGTCGVSALTADPRLDVAGVLAELRAAGSVVDASTWHTAHWSESRSRALGSHPDDLRSRRDARICVVDDPGTERISEAVRRLLRSSGMRHVDAEDPQLLVAVASGEPARDLFAALTSDRLAHLVVRADENLIRVGPTVLPGATPCLACHDLHRGDWDRGWPALIPQFGRRSPHHNPPAPSALTAQAAAIEVADTVLRLVDGQAPTGGIVTIGPHHGDRDERGLAVHPRCECALLPVGRTA